MDDSKAVCVVENTVVLFFRWWHQSALFSFLRRQKIEEFRFLGRCDLKLRVCLLDLRSAIGDWCTLTNKHGTHYPKCSFVREWLLIDYASEVARRVSVPVQLTCARRDRREERTEVKAFAKAQTLHDARSPTVAKVVKARRCVYSHSDRLHGFTAWRYLSFSFFDWHS